MALQPYQDEALNFFKFASLVLNEFPKALRQKFKSMWDDTYGHRSGFKLWDDSSAVRNLFASLEGDKNKVPIHTSYNEWDCTTLFQATIYAQSFACGRSFTLSDLYLKPLALPFDSFHASVTSPCGNEEETLALAIDQLRLLRNSLCHSVRSLMDRETFDQRMKQAKDAFTALGVATDLLDAVASLDESHFPTNEVHTLNKKIRKETQTCVQMLEDILASVEEWKRDTATKQDIAILSLKIDELKAAHEIREANLTGKETSTEQSLSYSLITCRVGENHPSIADSYHTLGVTERVRCNFPTALKYAQEALSIRLQLYGENHPSVAESYHALGDTQRAMGDYAAALESAKRALSIRRQVFGEEHLSTADIYHSLGDTQRALGDYPSAVESGKRALAIRLKLLGEEHVSTADIYHSIGDTQRALGDYPSALESGKRALAIRLKLLGEEHLSTADIYHSIGDTQRALGDYTSALESTKHALDIRLRLLGEEHPSTADIFHSLGDTQRALGDLSSAHQSQERALKIRQTLFGKQHVNIVDSTVDI